MICFVSPPPYYECVITTNSRFHIKKRIVLQHLLQRLHSMQPQFPELRLGLSDRTLSDRTSGIHWLAYYERHGSHTPSMLSFAVANDHTLHWESLWCFGNQHRVQHCVGWIRHVEFAGRGCSCTKTSTVMIPKYSRGGRRDKEKYSTCAGRMVS